MSKRELWSVTSGTDGLEMLETSQSTGVFHQASRTCNCFFLLLPLLEGHVTQMARTGQVCVQCMCVCVCVCVCGTCKCAYVYTHMCEYTRQTINPLFMRLTLSLSCVSKGEVHQSTSDTLVHGDVHGSPS